MVLSETSNQPQKDDQMTSPNTLWQQARRLLRNEIELRTWSRDNETETQFKIWDNTAAAIKIYSPTIDGPRSISKKEFFKVAEKWDAYCDGTVSRAELGKLSQNTSYVLGMLKWIEEAVARGEWV